MNRWKDMLVVALLFAPFAVAAQPIGSMARIGFLNGETAPTASDWQQRLPSYQALGFATAPSRFDRYYVAIIHGAAGC